MASSLESMAEKKASKAENISSRARDIIGRIKRGDRNHRQLVDEDPEHIGLHDTNSNAYSNSYSDDEPFSPAAAKKKLITVVSDPIDSPKAVISDIWRERDAERLANWGQEENCRLRVMSNGNDKSNYGSTRHREDTANGTSKADKWNHAIKQIQKHKKIIGRNRAKRIDQRSRWVFPLSFVIFNISYWTYYLFLKE